MAVVELLVGGHALARGLRCVGSHTARGFHRSAPLLLLLTLASCGADRAAAGRFADQDFKTAIAVIELHNTRFGHYPTSLEELKFLGDWDRSSLASVEYRPLVDGYELNLVGPWSEAERPSYPIEFFQRLGLKKTNIRTMESR